MEEGWQVHREGKAPQSAHLAAVVRRRETLGGGGKGDSEGVIVWGVTEAVAHSAIWSIRSSTVPSPDQTDEPRSSDQPQSHTQ